MLYQRDYDLWFAEDASLNSNRKDEQPNQDLKSKLIMLDNLIHLSRSGMVSSCASFLKQQLASLLFTFREADLFH